MNKRKVMVRFLKEQSWWLSLALGLIGALGSFFEWINIPQKPPAITLQAIALFNFKLPIPMYFLFILAGILLFVFKRKCALPKVFDFFIRSEGEQISFYLDNEHGRLRIWLNVINFSSHPILIDKILWELHHGQFFKKTSATKDDSIDGNSNLDTVLIEETVSQEEKRIIERQLGQSSFHSSLSLKVVVLHKGKRIVLDKTFTAPYIEVTGNIRESLDEHESAVLNLIANRADKIILKEPLFYYLETERKLTVKDTHLLISELEGTNYIEATKKFRFEDGMKIIDSGWKITNKGLAVLKEEDSGDKKDA